VDEGAPGMVKLPPPPKNMVVPAKARVRIITSKGPITVELNGKEAPLHVKSFLYLVGHDFYSGVQFHRYADLMAGSPDGKTGWIIQGGDPLTRSGGKRQYAGYQIPREHNKLKHERYIIAAARTPDPDSANSQFYFTIDPVPFLDEGDGYTVFGKIIEGQANAKKLRQGDVIKSVVILK
jgi:cyclophilin family peptidyl-prolyl cis-trans isomerase